MGMQFPGHQIRYTLLMVAALGWSQGAEAQSVSNGDARNAQPRRATPVAETHVLQTYEVSDLILNIQDHSYGQSSIGRPMSPAGGGFGGGGGGLGGGGGQFSVPDDFRTGNLGGNDRDAFMQEAVADKATATIRFCQLGPGGGMGGQRGGMSQAAATSITVNDLTRVLTTTIAAESWSVNGGEGHVEPLGTALVVWQTPVIHDHVQQLLTQIRKGSSDRKTVTIDARWLLLNSDELDGLLLADQEGVPKVDREILAQFTRRPGSIRGMTSCFSSQLVYLVSGTRRNVVSSYIPVVGSLDSRRRGEQFEPAHLVSLVRFASDSAPTSGRTESRVGYQPIVEKPNLGALLEIRPTLMQVDNSAVVDLKSTITVVGERPLESSGQNESASILTPEVDRIAIETQEFATTLRIPLGHARPGRWTDTRPRIDGGE